MNGVEAQNWQPLGSTTKGLWERGGVWGWNHLLLSFHSFFFSFSLARTNRSTQSFLSRGCWLDIDCHISTRLTFSNMSALNASVRASWGLESNAVCEAEGLRLDWNGMDYESFFLNCNGLSLLCLTIKQSMNCSSGFSLAMVFYSLLWWLVCDCGLGLNGVILWRLVLITTVRIR